MMESDMARFRIIAMALTLFVLWFAIQSQTADATTNISKKKRKCDFELPYHQKRRRQLWSPLKKRLGPDNFRTHHRISENLFGKIHNRIAPHIYTDPKYVRKSCCRGEVAHVDTRSRLSMTLKHLGGSRTCDIASFHGVSRQTVGHSIRQTFDAIIQEYPIAPFPFDNVVELQKLADGFKAKSTGGLFDGVVGTVDGFLLRVCKASIGNKSGIKDPSKFYCRKKYYAVNCQVCCDAHRRITSLSMLSPGAVPDTLAHQKSALHMAIEAGELPDGFYFLGDGAYPLSEHMLTPCKRPELLTDVDGSKDNYNFYLSQLRINIECCFGMLVNQWPILQSTLLTPRLRNALDTFHVCCILHNLCVNERLSRGDDCTTQRYAKGCRYTQVPRLHTTSCLRSASDFEFVDVVDEVEAHTLTLSHERDRARAVTEPALTRKQKMVNKIARSGYVRPSRKNK